MYPTLSDLINELFGVYIPLPIQTYGFFVAIAFLAAAYVVAKELKRKEREGKVHAFTKKVKVGEPPKASDLITSGILGFIIGYKLVDGIIHYSEFVANPQDFILSTDGSWWGGLLCAAGFALWNYYQKRKESQKYEKPRIENKTVHPHELTGNMLVWAAVAGLIGTKLFHLLENLDKLAADPWGQIFSFSGLSFFGGLIVGGGTLIYYANKHGIKPIHLLDTGAPAVALGYGLGRIGCQLSGDGCWGVINNSPKPDWMSFLPDWMWASRFPHNVINEGVTIEQCTHTHCHILENPVYPTSFYETVMMLIVFAILWSLRKQIKIPGIIFFTYLILQGIERFFIEKIRVNPDYHFLGVSASQAEIISVVLFVLGIGGIVFLVMRAKRKKVKEEVSTNNSE